MVGEQSGQCTTSQFASGLGWFSDFVEWCLLPPLHGRIWTLLPETHKETLTKYEIQE